MPSYMEIGLSKPISNANGNSELIPFAMHSFTNLALASAFSIEIIEIDYGLFLK